MYIAEVRNLLYRLGVTGNYTGFFHASYAVCLALRQPERLTLVTKLLYPEVAKYYGTTWKRVERNIRTVRDIAWASAPELLQDFACHSLTDKPGTAQFLAILASRMNT